MLSAAELELNRATGWAERWAKRMQIGLQELEQCLDIWGPGSIGAVTLAEIEQDGMTAVAPRFRADRA